jgi:hypothetical protein
MNLLSVSLYITGDEKGWRGCLMCNINNRGCSIIYRAKHMSLYGSFQESNLKNKFLIKKLRSHGITR